MDEHTNMNRINGSTHTKQYLSPPYSYGSSTFPTHPQPRMSYNGNFPTSNKDHGNYKQQLPKKSLAQNYNSNQQQPVNNAIKPQLLNYGVHGIAKSGGQSTQSSATSGVMTQKHIPSFLENRNQMKGSLLLNQQVSTKNSKNEMQFYNGNHYPDQNITKRAPRMSEQPDMKFSAIQFGSDNYGKIPSFLQEKPQKKEKKIPYQNQLQRPQSSKEVGVKSNFPVETALSLSNSYGSSKRLKSDEMGGETDPAAQWIKNSWNKKKQKKISLNDFDKIQDLGSGKYGQVYLARQKKTNFIFALKIIEKKLIKEEQIVQQFIRQLKIQSYLNNPNIIRMYGFFDDHTNIYIILEVGTGGQLFKQLKKHQSMPEAKVAGLIRQVCQALNELHSHHIIHRDIKPENIVMSQGVVKLCDFGWSVYSGETLRNTFCGTPLYVGPQILKGKEYDEKIDIWSLGVMMYEMLIGENPFKITKEEQLINIVKDEIKIPTYVQLSEEARSFLFSCLQKNPENRLSIRELLNHSFMKKYPEKSDKKMPL